MLVERLGNPLPYIKLRGLTPVLHTAISPTRERIRLTFFLLTLTILFYRIQKRITKRKEKKKEEEGKCALGRIYWG